MDLSGLLAISGKPGLYKVVAQAKNGLIVESLVDKKRMPAHATNKISALEDISMYTYTEDKPLADIIQAIYDKENGGKCIDAKKSSADELKDYFRSVEAEFDEDRIYNSDIKKLFAWYNLLQETGELKERAPKPEKKEAPKKTEAKEKKPAAKSTSAKASGEKKKTTTAKKPAAKKPAAKSASAKA